MKSVLSLLGIASRQSNTELLYGNHSGPFVTCLLSSEFDTDLSTVTIPFVACRRSSEVVKNLSSRYSFRSLAGTHYQVYCVCVTVTDSLLASSFSVFWVFATCLCCYCVSKNKKILENTSKESYCLCKLVTRNIIGVRSRI
jgi:phage-related holin